MAESIAPQVLLLNALAAGSRAAEKAMEEAPAGLSPGELLLIAERARGEAYAAYTIVPIGGLGEICLPFSGEGNGKRIYNLDTGEWGAVC
ncbi:MAG: hypothetical protein AAGD00_03600 [Planctomycetota bacterium]